MTETPWDSESDYAEFEHCGFRCILTRYEGTGAWNGYVEVLDLHPWYHSTPENVEIHGGITWRGKLDDFMSEPNKILVGFDCAHGFDLIPSLYSLFKEHYKDFNINKYRTIEYAKTEVKKLANQANQAGVFLKNPDWVIFTLGFETSWDSMEHSLRREFIDRSEDYI